MGISAQPDIHRDRVHTRLSQVVSHRPIANGFAAIEIDDKIYPVRDCKLEAYS